MSSMPFDETELALLGSCPSGQIRMWPGSPCVPMPAGNAPLFPNAPGGSAAGAAGQAASAGIQSIGFELLLGAGAIGMILLGVWMMAGSPKPQAIPVPV